MTRHRYDSTVPEKDEEFGPSKTQLKRDAHDLQDLGLALLSLPAAQLDRVEMEERLRDGLMELKRITAHGAKSRQARFVGKLLRDTDTGPLYAALAAHQKHLAGATSALKEVEHWRERLLLEDDALTALIEAHPAANTSQFRALLRNARREHAMVPARGIEPDASANHGRFYRELFKVLRDSVLVSIASDN